MYDYIHIRYKTREKALEILDRLKQLAENYGVVTVNDYNDIAKIKSSYTDTKYGWLEYMIKEAIVCNDNCGYYICLSRPIPIPDDRAETPKSDPQPIYITVHTNEISDLNKTLAYTFKYIYTIQDRTVNLTIM